MDIQITSRHFKARPSLLSYTEESVKKLTTLYDGIVNALVILENEPHTDGKMAEIVLMVYQDQLIAKEKSEDFEKSVAACIAKLEKQLLKYKDKLHHKGKQSREQKDVLLSSDEEI